MTGPDALAEAAAWWADAAPHRVATPVGVPGSGPVVFASIAFDPTAGTSVFVVPEVVVGRRDGQTWVTVTGEADEDRAVVETSPREAATSIGRLAYADGALDPVAWCGAVAAAVRRIDAGELDKVVLARDLLVTADRPLDPRRLLLRLAERFPDSWTFAVDGLLGATPELLLRRTGRVLESRVLAGTAPRGAGADDERLAAGLRASAKDHAEHAYAVDSLADALRPFVDDLDVPAEPAACSPCPTSGTWPATCTAGSGTATHRAAGAGRRRAPHRRGLRQPDRARPPGDRRAGGDGPRALRRSGRLAGRPRRRRVRPGAALRRADRRRRGRQARLFAGCGIVSGSDPVAELAETQAKLAAFQAALED